MQDSIITLQHVKINACSADSSAASVKRCLQSHSKLGNKSRLQSENVRTSCTGAGVAFDHITE